MTAWSGTADHRVTLGRVVHSEWTKLRSLRSTWWMLSIVALASVGMAGALGWGYEQQIDNGEVVATPGEMVGRTFIMLELIGLIVGVLGVLQMSGEYGSGSIRASLAAVPRRLPLLWAKSLALAGVTLPVMLVVCFASFLVCGAFAPSDSTGLGDSGVLRAVIAAATYPVALGLLGLAFGTLIRHTAGAITAFVGVLLIMPTLMFTLPGQVQDALSPYQPVVAGQAMFVLERGDESIELLSPGGGTLVLAAWVAVFLAAGAAALRRRDA